jgi:hypothetical protein
VIKKGLFSLLLSVLPHVLDGRFSLYLVLEVRTKSILSNLVLSCIEPAYILHEA